MHAPIPKEITDYREKIMFGLSIRQLLCFSAAIFAGVATWFICAKALRLPLDVISYVIIAEAAPFMALGFIRKDGQPFAKYAAMVIRRRFGRLRLHYEAAPLNLGAPDSATNAAPPRREKRNYHARFTGQTHPRLEYENFTLTKKDRQRKRKAAQRKIAAARQEYRAAKRRAKKAAAAASRAEKHFPMHQIPADVRGRRL
ncbi:MAG: PrgI family protein [Gracilibacteraceae bacterium]|jgi:hypothetical protein|nr:PrgI family protein [Gracilibacteraceae bacterium]